MTSRCLRIDHGTARVHIEDRPTITRRVWSLQRPLVDSRAVNEKGATTIIVIAFAGAVLPA